MKTSERSHDDAHLVQRCLKGDAVAWQQLVQHYAALVHSVPVRYGLTPAEVDDVGQEVFLALAQGLAQIEDPQRLSAWLITTARRFSWRALYGRRQEQPASNDDLAATERLSKLTPLVQPTPTVNELFAAWLRQEALQQGLQRLNERCRQLLMFLFLDPNEPSYTEISEQLGLPLGSIGPTRIRCLQQLRSILEGLGFERAD
jgi:RNA polymerase sigma factor (sigma-70 family)